MVSTFIIHKDIYICWENLVIDQLQQEEKKKKLWFNKNVEWKTKQWMLSDSYFMNWKHIDNAMISIFYVVGFFLKVMTSYRTILI